MGMSTYVVAIKPPDERWRAMQRVWDACESAGVPIPEDVKDYFGHEKPDPSGVTLHLSRTGVATRVQTENGDGYEVRVADLPDGVAVIRFINSW